MGNFHMFVVDNGRTLDVDALSDDLVTVLPNPNVGGSGGFARGMMAATEVEGAFTHVLVMDDDVRIVPESLIRTFNLLSLARGTYRNAFLNGAMLSLEHPTRQFEDVAFVNPTGVYAKVKRDYDVSRLFDICANERKDVEVPVRTARGGSAASPPPPSVRTAFPCRSSSAATTSSSERATSRSTCA